MATPALDLSPRPAVRREGRADLGPLRRPVGRPAAGTEGLRPEQRRENEHPGPPAVPRRGRATPGPVSAGRAGIRASRGAAVPGRLGRPPRRRDRPLRSQDGDRPVRPADRPSAGPPAVHRGRSPVHRRRQRLVAPRPSSDPADATARPADRAGPHTGACQLVEPGRGLLLDHPAEGTDAQRLPGPGRGAAAPGPVRGVDQPPAQAVRVEVHSRKTGGLVTTRPSAFRRRFGLTPKAWPTTTLFVKRTTKDAKDAKTANFFHTSPPHFLTEFRADCRC